MRLFIGEMFFCGIFFFVNFVCCIELIDKNKVVL